MSRLGQLYEHMILDHNKHPRNFIELPNCTHYSHGHNPLCGDDFMVMINVKDDVIVDIGFKGKGCAISKASGSLMTESLKGLSVADALKMKTFFLTLITTDQPIDFELGKLKVFEGVKKYPIRVKCAALTWRALEDALENKSNDHKITTE